MKDQIAIIGAGIGGLCAAIAVQKLGYNVKLFEKQPQTLKLVQV